MIPFQNGTALNTTISRKLNYSLLVFLDNQMEASGDVFLDDGQSLEIKELVYDKLTLCYSCIIAVGDSLFYVWGLVQVHLC